MDMVISRAFHFEYFVFIPGSLDGKKQLASAGAPRVRRKVVRLTNVFRFRNMQVT
jgi:hypothetical protein